jgi:uncharacterized protein YjbJ (UPF0337 family)
LIVRSGSPWRRAFSTDRSCHEQGPARRQRGRSQGLRHKGIGSITGNEDRKVKGEVQITNGDNRKDLGDQKEKLEKGEVEPGNPSNL